MSSSAVTPLQLRERYELINPVGDTYLLQDGRTRTILQSSGEGTPPIEYLTTSGPLQDGATLRGFRLRPRTLIYLVRWQGCSRDQYNTMRATLEDIIRPNQSYAGQLNTLTLRKRLNSGVIRDIGVVISDGPGFAPVSGWDGFGFTETLRFTALDPTWYDPTVRSEAGTPTTTDSLVFPFTAPFVFGSIGQTTVFPQYRGNWPAFPTIYVDGPINGPSVYRYSSGPTGTTTQYLTLSVNLAAGDRITFDLRYGVKSITRQSDGANLIPYLSANSDLANFHLAPYPEAPHGNPALFGQAAINNVTLYGTGTVVGQTLLTVSWNDRFYGI